MSTQANNETPELSKLDAHALIDTKTVANVLKTGRRNLSRWIRSGRVLQPIKVGQQNRWRAGEIRSWINAGCPRASDWMKVKAI